MGCTGETLTYEAVDPFIVPIFFMSLFVLLWLVCFFTNRKKYRIVRDTKFVCGEKYYTYFPQCRFCLFFWVIYERGPYDDTVSFSSFKEAEEFIRDEDMRNRAQKKIYYLDE